MKKDRERKEKAEAEGGDVDNIMDEDNDEDDVPAITVYVRCLTLHPMLTFLPQRAFRGGYALCTTIGLGRRHSTV